jgi:hypothetical protein
MICQMVWEDKNDQVQRCTANARDGKVTCEYHKFEESRIQSNLKVRELEDREKIHFEVTRREHANILAALRLWQDRDEIYTNGKVEGLEQYIVRDAEETVMDEDELERLIDTIN